MDRAQTIYNHKRKSYGQNVVYIGPYHAIRFQTIQCGLNFVLRYSILHPDDRPCNEAHTIATCCISSLKCFKTHSPTPCSTKLVTSLLWHTSYFCSLYNLLKCTIHITIFDFVMNCVVQYQYIFSRTVELLCEHISGL